MYLPVAAFQKRNQRVLAIGLRIPVSEVERPIVLVLEPEILVRMTVCDYLRRCGYHVIEAHSSDDVMAVLQSGLLIDVLFSEVRLPGTEDGFGLAQRVRQIHPRVDVILTSGIDDTAEKSNELCAEGPIGKPYHPEDVAQRIKRLLERRRTSDQKI